MKSEIPVLLGTYTEPLPHVEGRGPGILPCCLDLETGAIRPTGPAIPVRNPAYLWRNGSLLYATSEISDFEGNEDGSLTVLRINERTIESIQTTSSEGSGPAWICGEATGRWLLVANYLEGNCKVFSLGENGSIRESVTSLRFSGSGTDPIRQDASHPHAILASPDNRHIYLADLGTDKLVIFDFDEALGALTTAECSPLDLPPVSGPRHLLFHPEAELLFVVLELSSELAVFETQASGGSLRLLSQTSSVPPDTTGNHPSEIALSKDGHHLYMANRGHDSIAHFIIDPGSGSAELRSNTPCLGRIPRHLALSPDDSCLLVANQESDRVVSFHRDPTNGSLQATGQSFDIGTPCFVLF